MTKIIYKIFVLTSVMLCMFQTAYAASEFRAYTSSTVNALCATGADGSAKVVINGGEKFTSGDPFSATVLRNNESYVASFTFTSDESGTQLQLDGLKPGYYFVTLSDKLDATASVSFTIESPSAIVVTIASITDVACTGDSTGVAALVITGGKEPYTVVCSDAITGDEAGVISVINHNAKITGLYLGQFNVTVTDYNSCTPELGTTFTVASPFDPITYTPGSNNVSCFGGETGKIFGEARGGKLPFQYNIVNNTTPYTAGNATGTFAGLPVGNYTATATDANGCKVVAENIIVDTPEEVVVKDIATKPAATVVCAEDKTASIKFTVTGRIEPVAPSDTAVYYSLKLFHITDQHEVATTDFKQTNKFHPVFTQPKYCDSIKHVKDPDTGEIIEEIPVHYVCGKDTIWTKGCHEPTKESEIGYYPIEWLGFDCDDYITVANLKKGAYRIEFYRGACQLGSYKEFTIEQTGNIPQTVYIDAIDPVCDGSELTVVPTIVSNPAIRSYKWTLSGINVATTKDFKHTYSMAEDKRILQLEATNACGSTKSNETQVAVLPRPTAVVSAADEFLCEGTETEITIEFKGTAPFIYTLTSQDESSTFNAVEKTKVTPERSSEYTLTQLEDANCAARLEEDVTPTYITIYPQQSVDLEVVVPEPMVSGRYVTVTATPGFVSYNLEMNGEVMDPTEQLNVYKIKQFPYGTSTNNFLLTVEDANGCFWEADASAVVESETFPNIFTPNEDGINDIFLEGYDIEVFDRWGTLLFAGTEGWNGKHNGDYVNPGVYLYVVKINNQAGEEMIVKKTVTVER